MTDLTIRLLAEIERREGNWRQPEPTNGDELGYTAREVLAYLAALRKIVGLHDGAHQCHDHEGTVTIVRDECATLLAVAEALGVTA